MTSQANPRPTLLAGFQPRPLNLALGAANLAQLDVRVYCACIARARVDIKGHTVDVLQRVQGDGAEDINTLVLRIEIDGQGEGVHGDYAAHSELHPYFGTRLTHLMQNVGFLAILDKIVTDNPPDPASTATAQTVGLALPPLNQVYSD